MRLRSVILSILVGLGMVAPMPVQAAFVPCGGNSYIDLYEHINYGGASFRLCYIQNNADLSRAGWNDRASSLRATYGLQDYALERQCYYQDANYGGPAFVTMTPPTDRVPDLRVYGWNDRISSVRWKC